MSDSRGPGSDGPEWLVEHGIGESRALLVHGEEVVAAKLHWSGDLPVDSTALAQLVSKPAGGARGLARMANGTGILIDRIPPRATEGSALTLRITRAAIAERGRFKRAQGRVIESEADAPPPRDNVFVLGVAVRRLPGGEWDEIWHAAAAGEVAFTGGALLFSVTPAMTLIDIDGDLAPRDLALAAIPAIARWLRLYMTPEETTPPDVLAWTNEDVERAETEGLAGQVRAVDTIADPIVWAIHWTMSPDTRSRHSPISERLNDVARRALDCGPHALNTDD